VVLDDGGRSDRDLSCGDCGGGSGGVGVAGAASTWPSRTKPHIFGWPQLDHFIDANLTCYEPVSEASHAIVVSEREEG
jgi:hypothetical protein